MRSNGLHVFIGGLLLVQALFALLFGFFTEYFFVEIIFACFFLLFLIIYLLSSTSAKRGVYSSIGFAIGFIHIVVVSLLSISSWLIIVILLNATGFFWSLELVSVEKKPLPKKKLTHRRVFLDKELPEESVAKVQVYYNKKKKRV